MDGYLKEMTATISLRLFEKGALRAVSTQRQSGFAAIGFICSLHTRGQQNDCRMKN